MTKKIDYIIKLPWIWNDNYIIIKVNNYKKL